MNSSDLLELNSVYSRKELQNLFNITDATINNGIFQPKGHSSVWECEIKSKKNREERLKLLVNEILINH